MEDNRAMVIFQPSGQRGLVPKGISLIEASRLIGVDIEALCGEKKVCGKCIVRIEDGYFEKFNIRSNRSNVSPWQEEEEKFINAKERDEGFRLGCVARIESDVLVFVPEESRAGKQVVVVQGLGFVVVGLPVYYLWARHQRPEASEAPDTSPAGEN